jgi:DNA-binding LytR/AlgR family response regulator
MMRLSLPWIWSASSTRLTARCWVRWEVGAARALIDKHEFDFALLDANLGGHSAETLARAIATRHIRFAYITGYTRAALLADFRSVPVIGKPFSHQQIKELVRRLAPRAPHAMS